MNSSERRLKLILLLQQSTRRWTVNDIAEKFNVSRRTVFRDFNSLSELNVPVTWDEYKGYGIMPGYKIPPLMFTTKELATILVGLNFVKSQVDRTLVEDAEGVELKIHEVLPDDLQQFMGSLQERMVVDPYLNFGAEKMEGGNWYLISSAISENRSISCRYLARGESRPTDRKIDPYLLVFYRDHWNLIGYSHKRSDFRNFVLDRMEKVEILDDNFVPEAGMDTEDLIYRSDGRSHLVRVDVSESTLNRFEANLPAKVFKKERINPNFFRISFYFDNLDFINEWLLQFPHDVTIVEPDTLIDKRKNILTDMLSNIKV